tara:strand:- start:295 stop:438 length:144 start_codon:yes stop_codon:yes gene_type:complete
MKNTEATAASVFLPFGTNKKKGQPTQKKQKLAKGTRENARMNSAVVV